MAIGCFEVDFAMTLRIRSLVFSMLALAGLGAGCGDSSPSNPDAGPLLMNQCVGPSDIAIITALVEAHDGGRPDGGVPDGGPYPVSYWNVTGDELDMCGSGPCLSAILNDNGAEECMDACLPTTGLAGISDGCVACQIELIRCVTANCITECLGSDEALCIMCGYEACGLRLADCTGLTPPLP